MTPYPDNPTASPEARPAQAPRPSAGRFRPFRRLIAISLLAGVAAAMTAYCLATWRNVRQYPIRPLELSGQWMQAPGGDEYAGCFRLEFHLPGKVRNAWMAVAACDSFEATINGRPVGWKLLWRPTRPFQSDISEFGQRINWPQSALSLNFAREYQWEDHRAYQVPIFIDVTRYFDPGKNVICLDLQSRHAPAKVLVDGVIELWNGEKKSLSSGPQWRGEPVPPTTSHTDWRAKHYDSLGWRTASGAESPPGGFYCVFNPRMYSTALDGQWLRHLPSPPYPTYRRTAACH